MVSFSASPTTAVLHYGTSFAVCGPIGGRQLTVHPITLAGQTEPRPLLVVTFSDTSRQAKAAIILRIPESGDQFAAEWAQVKLFWINNSPGFSL